MSTNLTIATWLSIAGLLGYALYAFGWGTAGIALGVFVVVSILVGAVLIPGPEAPHFIRLIYRSMVRRYADFEKRGDSVRSAAMKDLIDRVGARYIAELPN
jgi:hypothetical protein